MPDDSRTSDWFTRFRNAYAIHNVTAWRQQLPLFLLLWDGDGEIDWMDLTNPQQDIKPFHFEIYFGKESARDEYYLDALERCTSRKQPLVTDLFGFSDLFHSLGSIDHRHAFLFAGQFYRKQPHWESLSQQWRDLTAHEPASANPDFVKFVRMALTLPVLDGELLKAMRKFMVIHGQFLTGARRKESIQERVDALNRDTLSRLWPNETWIASAISANKFRLTPWYLEGKLADWMKEGMGISRLPTAAMTLMPLDSRTEALDPVQTLVRNAGIQRALIAFAREMPETAATPLQDYGVSVITSTKRAKNVARRRLELRERAQKLRTFIRQEFNVQSVAGIGDTLAPGAPLYDSHRQAVLAMHMCVQLNKSVLFHDEHASSERFQYSALNAAARAQLEALERENATELKLASDRYVQLVLHYAHDRIEVARGQFLAMLFQMFDAVQRHQPMRNDARERFAEDLTARVEQAQSLYQLIEAFNGALQRLSFVSSRAWQGPSVMRLEATLQYLRENFVEPLPLPEIARRAGFSVPAFSRVFKKATGTTFLAYRRALRVDHAKKLLTTTPMTMEQVAQACGFQSQHHLIRSFKKVTEMTPGGYRKVHARRYGEV